MVEREGGGWSGQRAAVMGAAAGALVTVLLSVGVPAVWHAMSDGGKVTLAQLYTPTDLACYVAAYGSAPRIGVLRSHLVIRPDTGCTPQTWTAVARSSRRLAPASTDRDAADADSGEITDRLASIGAYPVVDAALLNTGRETAVLTSVTLEVHEVQIDQGSGGSVDRQYDIPLVGSILLPLPRSYELPEGWDGAGDTALRRPFERSALIAAAAIPPNEARRVRLHLEYPDDLPSGTWIVALRFAFSNSPTVESDRFMLALGQ